MARAGRKYGKKFGKLGVNIEKLREKMLKSGMENGLSHPETIRLSEELDKLIFQTMLGRKE